jgi:hypothetical protein
MASYNAGTDDALIREILDEIASGVVVVPDVVTSEEDDTDTAADDEESSISDLELEMLYQHNQSDRNLLEAEVGLKRAQKLVETAKEHHQITGARLFDYYNRMEITLPTVEYNNDPEAPSPPFNIVNPRMDNEVKMTSVIFSSCCCVYEVQSAQLIFCDFCFLLEP